jgi:hypothetical protein
LANTDIFDLEQNIMKCWSVTDDINALHEQMLDSVNGMSDDEISNYLIGLNAIYQVKFERLWANFETICHEYHKLKKGIKNEC